MIGKRRSGVMCLVSVLLPATAFAADRHSPLVRNVTCSSPVESLVEAPRTTDDVMSGAAAFAATGRHAILCREVYAQPTPTARIPKPGHTSLKAWLIAGVVVAAAFLVLYLTVPST